jgi:hypothetical protein
MNAATQNPNIVSTDPRSYHPALFRNRQAEIEQVGHLMAQLIEGKILSYDIVINYWGTSGLGKTWLVNHLAHQYQARPGATTASFAVIYNFTGAEATHQLTSITRGCAAAVLGQLPPEPDSAWETHLKAAQTDGKPESLVHGFVALAKKQAFLLVLDNAELLSREQWGEIEENLIEPLALTGRGLIIIAGRHQVPRWKGLEVRRRLMNIDKTLLAPFNRQEIQAQLEALDDRPPAEFMELIYQNAGGNPLLADLLVRNFHDWARKMDRQPFIESIRTLASSDLHALLVQFEQQQLKSAQDPKLAEVIDNIFPLRLYDVDAIRIMLQGSDPEYNQKPDYYFLELLRRLDKETVVVWWDNNDKAWITSPAVRRLIERRHLIENKQRLSMHYSKLHQRAIAMYWQWSSETPRVSDEYLVEILYHQSSLFLLDEDLPKLQKTANQLLNFARQHFNITRLNRFQKRLAADTELCALLPTDLQTRLEAELEAAIEALAHTQETPDA